MNNARRRAMLAATSLVGLAATGPLGACSKKNVHGGAGPGPASAGARYDGTVAVNGSTLVNGAGQSLQLRGTNIQDHCGAMITGSSDASGGAAGGNDQAHGPNTALLKNWKMNAIRIGINEASWLGYECYDTAGTVLNTGAGAASYRAQIAAQIAQLNAIDCYVILVLAWTSPGRSAPLGQDIMANQDNSVQCWQSLAATFGYPNGTALRKNGGPVDDRSVIFELFNEPFTWGGKGNGWDFAMNGGFFPGGYNVNAAGKLGLPYTNVYPFACAAPSASFTPGEKVWIGDGATAQVLCCYQNNTSGLPSSGARTIHLFQLSSTAIPAGATVTGTVSGAKTATTSAGPGWHVAGMAQMLAAVRNAGAWNPCLIGGLNYDKDLSQWARFAPTDLSPPAGYAGPPWTPQIGAAWHPYPAASRVNTATIARGGHGYRIGDTILLPMPESGADANSVYWQAQLQVAGVSGSSVSEVRVIAYTGGTPGRSGGNASQYSGRGMVGGAYSNLRLPDNPVPQYSSSGAGTDALFNLSFTDFEGGGWPNHSEWNTVTALRVTPGVPVVITETGEHAGDGVSGSPWMSELTAWCDANGIGLVCYAYTPSWYVASGYDFNLVTNGSQPSPGYGEFMHRWFTTHP